MATIDEFIRRIVSRSGIVKSRVRRDLERELRAHFEDAMEEERCLGHEATHIADRVYDRFGDPDEIACEFELVHRFDRWKMSIANAVVLMSLSVLAVAAVILGLQLIIAASRGISPPHAFPRLRGELVAFISLVAGYMGLYLEERLASNFRLLKAFAVNSALFAVVFGISSAVLHQNTAAPALAFLAGLAVRTLQNTSWRAFWFLGPAVPIAVACVNAGKLLSLESEPLSWPAVFIRWAGLTGACYLLTLLSRSHEAYYGARESSH